MRGWQQAKGIVGHGFNPEKSLRLCVKKYFGPSAKNKKDISRKGAKNSIEEGERVAAG